MPKLCLGTVQFGLPYGVTNQFKQVPEAEVRRILDLAAGSGVELLDTAQSYGSAETVLGRCWPKDAPRRIISKLGAGKHRSNWEESLHASLQRLNVPNLDGFLLHRASDLLAPDGGELLDWLESLRKRGLVDRIGVSIYESSELEALPLERLQLVQIPLSVYDQRLIRDGTVRKLQEMSIAVHVRSVLLQGLLVQSPERWPAYLSKAFQDHHKQWLEHLRQKRLTPLEAAIDFVSAYEGIEAVLCGVVSLKELTELLQAWGKSTPNNSATPEAWAWQNKIDLDPRCWTTS